MGEAESIAAVQATVRGRVQGVGFRYFIQDHAERLRLSGWVRNASDGQTVEMVAEGDQASVEELLRQAEHGPPGASVERVETEWITPRGQSTTFEISH